MTKKYILIIAAFSLFISCQILPVSKTGIDTENNIDNNAAQKPEKQTEEEPQPQIIQKPDIHTLTLIAAGDNLFHETIYKSYYRNGIYEFSEIYSEIKELIQSADLAYVNQETVMAGSQYGYSGYPAFNTPQTLAQTLYDTGFTIINQANNHALDMGENGLIATLDLWDKIENVTVLGARKTGDNYKVITKNNISLGFLSYTFSLNGNVLSAKNKNLVSMISRKKIEEEIAAVRPLCDFLIVSMHWGDEYMFKPNKEQTELALFLASQNVDLIIGHHPHVLQPFEYIKRPDGKQTLCFYSLGNFVSNQSEKERILGALIYITFVKEDGQLSIKEPQLIPVICHFEAGYTKTKVYPLYDYTSDLLKKHWIAIKDKSCTFDFFNGILKNLGIKPATEKPY